LKNEKQAGAGNNGSKEKAHIMNISHNVKNTGNFKQNNIKKSPESIIPFDDNEVLKQF